MKISKTYRILFLIVLLGLLGVRAARAIRPFYSPFAVVAGTQYTAGFQDGSFSTARFNQPLGLTISDDGTRLFVADSLNNRIRVVHLDQNNEVGTIAGQDSAGNSDGPLTLAQFHEPRGVLYLPGDYLAVYDWGNHRLCFVDMKKGTVTTYRGDPVHLDGSDAPNPKATPVPALKPPVPLDGIKDLAYLRTAHSILFTQPEAGVLNKLDLGTGQMTAILKDNVQLPHPSALWIQEDKIYVADRDLLNIFSMNLKNNAVINMLPVGTSVDKLLSISSRGNDLYGLLKKDGYPTERFDLNKHSQSGEVLKFNNGWGDFVPPEKYWYQSLQPESPWIGLVPDPLVKRKFFYSLPTLNLIVSLREWEPGNQTVDMSREEYPADKPKNTYRILLCGPCHGTDTDNYLFPTDSHPVSSAAGQLGGMPYNLSVAPQLERELNLRAALDDNPMNYEVINASHHGDIIFWPTNEVPDEVKKYDIDLVVIYRPALDFPAYYYYYLYNLTPDGIPQVPPDTEYVLKPPLERIPDGLPRKYYDYCKERNWVKVNGNNLQFDEKVNTDPKAKDMLQEFWEKPWQVLNSKLSSMRASSGKPVRMLILFGYIGLESPAATKPDFYKDLARRCNIAFLDLAPYQSALNLSYFPMTGTGHVDPNGAVFFGKLLAHYLPDEGLIPWPTPEKTPAK